jgi:ubiquinone/menaquinone biosynthesis C-methylase UbiE
MSIDKKYYEELEKFKKNSLNLIQKGGAYFAIIANHELYRFLYPYEPYEHFHNNNPVEFITKKIMTLNSFLEISLNTICFYNFDLNKMGNILSNKNSLEKQTSDVYTSLWSQFEEGTIFDESKLLIQKRVPKDIIDNYIKGKVILDMGCGSGRYSLALSLLGAKKVYAIDLFAQSYQNVKKIVDEKNLNVEFIEANFHDLPFKDETFDFIFCNGTIHHSRSIQKSLDEYKRVLKQGGKGFLYIYADYGIFWNTRKIMRDIFQNIPIEYTNNMLSVMGVPSNRFIFSDVWHVPIETHTSKTEIETLFELSKLSFKKVISNNEFDLDYAIEQGVKNSNIMWGDGEHRYIIYKEINV